LGSLKDKVFKTNSHILEELRNICLEISTTFGQKSREHIKGSSRILNEFGQESNIFSIYCSTGEFLIGFLKVIITTNLFLALFTDC
jgi:hypothetical protein